jgi:ACS family hexuronate transporter-like MFS transporter
MKPKRSLGALSGDYRWLICALIFFATTINYVDRQILSLVKEQLDLQFGWSKADFGLVNSLFQVTYGLGFIFFGWFVDRFGVRAGYAASMVGWSIAAMAHALVRLVPADASIQIAGHLFGTTAMAVAAFGSCRVLLGLAEGGNFPAAIKGAAQWFPQRERAFATGIFNTGTNVGALVAPAVVPFLAVRFGWEMPFVCAGLIGFVWLGFWLRIYDSPEKHPGVTKEELAHIRSGSGSGGEARKIPWLELLRYRQVWAIAVAKFLTDPVWWFFLIWLPDYFKTAHNLDIKHSWPLLVTIYGVITVLSIFGGWATGHLAESGWSITRARKAGMLVCALCMPPVFFATHVGGWAAVALIALAGSAQQAWSVNLFSTASDMFPKDAVASVVGLAGLVGSLGGMLCPVLTGMVLDHYRVLGNEKHGYAILFSICAFAHLLAFSLNHLLAPSYEPVKLS